LRWVGDCYRAHHPQWAWTPLSGDGAAIRGGRFNPVGTPALYLALTLEGMFLEMGHGLSRVFEPLTVCTYRVDSDDIVDLRTAEERSAARIGEPDMACAWEYELSERRRPASWAIHDRLARDGAAGILVPSYARGARPDMHNLVLWRWGPNPPHKVEVHDPSGRLPKNQLSWR
jgi:RES domain-containing protein